MLQGLLSALHLLLAQLKEPAHDPGFQPPAHDCASDYLPSAAELGILVGNEPDTIRTRVAAFLAEVRAHADQARAAGLLDPLHRVRTAAIAYTANPSRPALAGLPKNDFGDKRHHLLLDDNGVGAGAEGSVLAEPLVLATQSLEEAWQESGQRLKLIEHLRHFDNVLIRVLAAHRASTVTGFPIAEVLALYRTEGDLQVPPSTASIELGIPSFTTRAASLLEGMAHRNIACLTFLESPATTSEEAARVHALRTWMVQLAGLDLPGQLLGTPRMPDFPGWSKTLWAEVYGASDPNASAAAAAARWEALKQNLKVVRVGHDGGPDLVQTELASTPAWATDEDAIRVTPDDPVALIGDLLAEAVVFARNLRQSRHMLAPLEGDLGPGLGYVLYNLQTGPLYPEIYPNVPKRDGSRGPREAYPHQAVLISALAAASQRVGSRFRDLHQAIQADADFAAKMKALRRTIVPMTPTQIRDDHWPAVLAWLSDSAQGTQRTGLLADFVANAGTAQWDFGPKESRGYMSRYLRILDFYSELFF